MPGPRVPLTVLLVALLAPAPARAQAAADSGRLIVFQGDMPVANERFSFQFLGDSLALTAVNERRLLDDKGQRHLYRKSMLLVADARDFGLQRYFSVQEFQGRKVTRGLVPGDTSITYYVETDGVGDAIRHVQPPGRLYVLDSSLFSLFEVLCRGLAGRQFATRRVQLLALADSLTTPLASVTRLAPDTLRAPGRRVIASRYRFEDASVTFELWADERGRLLRLTHPASDLHVEREPDAPAAAPKRRARKAG
jgi:hypothetical protein